MKFGILLSLSLVFSSFCFAEMSDMEAAEQAAETTAVGKTTQAKAEANVLSDDATPVAAQPAEKTKAEDEIPVNFTKAKKSETTESSSGRLFLTFGLMAVFLGIGYYFAKKYGKPKNAAQTKIKILTQHYLGPKRSLAIVRVAGESILIGITDQNINMIKSLSLLDDEIILKTICRNRVRNFIIKKRKRFDHVDILISDTN